MFSKTAPVTETRIEVVPADDPIPISHLALDLDAPAIGWAAYLKGRGLEVLTDDIGRKAVSRADARTLIAEKP